MNYNVKQFIKGDLHRLFPLGKSSNFLSALGLSQILSYVSKQNQAFAIVWQRLDLYKIAK